MLWELLMERQSSKTQMLSIYSQTCGMTMAILLQFNMPDLTLSIQWRLIESLISGQVIREIWWRVSNDTITTRFLMYSGRRHIIYFWATTYSPGCSQCFGILLRITTCTTYIPGHGQRSRETSIPTGSLLSS